MTPTIASPRQQQSLTPRQNLTPRQLQFQQAPPPFLPSVFEDAKSDVNSPRSLVREDRASGIFTQSLPMQHSLLNSSSTNIDFNATLDAAIGSSNANFTDSEEFDFLDPSVKKIIVSQLDKERLQLSQKLEKKVDAHVKEEKARLARLWSQEKRDILRRANEDRQELVTENSRLRKEMSSKTSGNIAFNKSSDNWNEEKQDLLRQISHLEYERDQLTREIIELRNKQEDEKNYYEDELVSSSCNMMKSEYFNNNTITLAKAKGVCHSRK